MLSKAAILAGSCLLAAGAQAGDLELRRVMMSTGGVAYMEFAGSAGPDGTVGLDVRLDQVDDVLKSLVVFDAAGGVGGLSLPGRDNAAGAYADLPFGPEALESPMAYLNALRGVRVEVSGPRPMTGLMLRAEKIQIGDRPETLAERTRVSLMAEDGLRQFVLEEADAVQVADPILRGRIARAMATLRGQADATNRRIVLRRSGPALPDGVHVGYVAAAPLWKMSYRLVLPAAGATTARLQGWAVLENATASDWNGVQLRLQYGNPVTFRQAIYRSYFVERPEVPVELLGRLLPGIDTAARAVEPAQRPRAMAAPPPAPAPAARSSSLAAGLAEAHGSEPALVMAAPAEEARAAEGAQDTVFVVPDPVVLPAGHSASVPVLDRQASARLVGLVQSPRRHPLAAVRLTNDTPTSLPAGVLTLYDPDSASIFAGDARLGGMARGETRLLSYAEDLRTDIVWQTEQAASVAAVTAAAGVLRVDERLRWTTKVTLTAPATEPRDLLVEIPRPAGAGLADDNDMRPSEQTAAAWRFAVRLEAGATRTLSVAAERITRQQTALITDDSVVTRLLGRPGLGEPAAAALRRLVSLRTAKAGYDAELARLAAQIAEVEADEERIRGNLGAVPANDALHTRLVRRLDAAETRIDALRVASARAQAAADQAQRELVAAVAAFTL